MKDSAVGIISYEAVSDGSAAKLHIEGTRKRLEVEGFDAIYTALSSRPNAIARWLEVFVRSLQVTVNSKAVVIRFHPIALFSVAWARMARKRVVILLQGVPEDAYSAHPWVRGAGPLYLWAVRTQLKMAHALVTPTAGIARWVLEHLGREAMVLPNGAALGPVAASSRVQSQLPDRYVCFSGSLASWQGVDVMLDAVTSQSWPRGVRLVVVGDGPSFASLADLRDDRVIAVGRLPSSEARLVLSGALASLSAKTLGPSTQHGVSPFKVLESAALGIPLVVSRIDGQWEGVDRFGAGLVVEPGDAEGLAKAVERIARDSELRSEFGRQALKLALESRWESHAGVLAQAVLPPIDENVG